jgi:hypothetical protein
MAVDERLVLRLAAAGMALLELVMVFATEFWPAALVMAVVFGLLAWRLPRGGRGVLAGLVVAFLIELLPLAFYPRETRGDWIAQGLTAVLSLVGLVLAIRLLVRSRAVATVAG